MSFKKEDDERCKRTKKRSDQWLQARTLKWERKLFIHQWISSCIACFNQYLQDENEVIWWWWKVMRTRRMKVSTQLLDTISHDWEKSYSLFHYWRWKVRWVLMQALKWWVIACAARHIDSWKWRKAEFIMQSCFSSKQCLYLRACSMKTRHVWVVITFRWWTQRQHQIFWSWLFNIHQYLLKYTKINMSIRDHKLSHQCSRCKKAEEADVINIAVTTTWRETYTSRKWADFASMLAWSQWARMLLLIMMMMMMMMLILLCHSC